MEKTVIKHDDEYYYNIIRKNIKAFRTLKGYTQQDLADMTDLSRQYITDLESKARNKHISIAVLGRILDALDIDISKFFI